MIKRICYGELMEEVQQRKEYLIPKMNALRDFEQKIESQAEEASLTSNRNEVAKTREASRIVNIPCPAFVIARMFAELQYREFIHDDTLSKAIEIVNRHEKSET